MNKTNNESDFDKKYYIPINGKLYETSQEVYKVYYSMDRRERYLEERSKEHELSYDALKETDYPIHDKLVKKEKDLEEAAITSLLIEQMLSVMTGLTEPEKWLLEQLFFIGKSEVELAKVSGISRTTLQSRKYSVLRKIRYLMDDGER